ncbi:MAG: adenylate/guanylate cyclase domain-containing protein [Armatimonadota bacterium]
MLRHQQSEETRPPAGSVDSATLGKVAALAQRLQTEHQDRLTAAEMEEIGREIGLDPAFMRQALEQVCCPPAEPVKSVPLPPAKTTPPSPTLVTAPGTDPRPWWRRPRLVAPAWWAAGWVTPMMLVAMAAAMDVEALAILGFFGGWALYIGGGVAISHAAAEEKKALQPEQRSGHLPSAAPRGFHQPHHPPVRVPTPSGTQVSRAAMLDLLFTLQRELEGQKQRRAFLSIDVAGSSEMKRGADELAVEYSFGQFSRWVEDMITRYGGTVHSAAGDGVMCVFPDDVSAVRAARHLQESMVRFNGDRNRLPTPFRVRCGVSAGNVAITNGHSLGGVHSAVIDRAALLQKQAEPGDVLVSGDVSGAALSELGQPSLAPQTVDGAAVFSWRGGR